jgi:hypothetical protein
MSKVEAKEVEDIIDDEYSEDNNNLLEWLKN